MVPEGWRTVTVSELASIVGGGTPSKSNPEFWNGSIPWASPKDIDGPVLAATEDFITEEAVAASATTLVDESAILLVVRSGILRHTLPVTRVLRPTAINQDIKALTPKACASRDFLYQSVAGRASAILARCLNTGTTVESISSTALAAFELLLPPLPEQKKIAAILSSVDDTIAATRKLIEQTEQVKKGLLQTLMTRGIGHTRFKTTEIGEIPEAWEVMRLGEVATLQRGFDITVSDQIPGAVPVVSSSGTSSWHNEAKVDPPGVVTGRKGRLGNVYFLDVPFWPHDTTLWVKNFHTNEPRWISWLLRWLRLERFDAATSVPTLNRNNVHPLRVGVPTFSEQMRIADQLDAWDALGTQYVTLQVHLETLKRGLMQDLLTGRVRVTPD